jgi:ribosome-binding factor A
MSSRRLIRMGEEIKKLVSSLIMNDLKDPRISPMTSVIQVEVTKDLRYAKIYISVMGTDKEKEETIKGLNSSKGFIRKEIGQQINLRYTPEPVFELDHSIDHGIKISEMLRDINKK